VRSHRAEFGSQSAALIGRPEALERMNRHETITGIPMTVMVFLKAFSRQLPNALKHTDLIAAVNNDLISTDCTGVQ
jgi:hypothetical protein